MSLLRYLHLPSLPSWESWGSLFSSPTALHPGTKAQLWISAFYSCDLAVHMCVDSKSQAFNLGSQSSPCIYTYVCIYIYLKAQDSVVILLVTYKLIPKWKLVPRFLRAELLLLGLGSLFTMLILIVGLGSHQLISLLVKCPSQSMVPFTALSVSIIVFRIQINSQPALPPSVFNYNSSVKIVFFFLWLSFLQTS